MVALSQVLDDLVFISDRQNHASLIEGIRNSRADKIVFGHNDLADLERSLKSVSHRKNKVIVFESVYSMSGSVAPMKAICDLAVKYNALTFVDEVHAVGLYGKTGAGLAEVLGIQDDYYKWWFESLNGKLKRHSAKWQSICAQSLPNCVRRANFTNM